MYDGNLETADANVAGKPNSITIKTPNEKGFKYAKRKGYGDVES